MQLPIPNSWIRIKFFITPFLFHQALDIYSSIDIGCPVDESSFASRAVISMYWTLFLNLQMETNPVLETEHLHYYYFFYSIICYPWKWAAGQSPWSRWLQRKQLTVYYFQNHCLQEKVIQPTVIKELCICQKLNILLSLKSDLSARFLQLDPWT